MSDGRVCTHDSRSVVLMASLRGVVRGLTLYSAHLALNALNTTAVAIVVGDLPFW